MVQPLSLLLLSFFLTSVLIVPFIDFLYKVRFRRKRQITHDALGRRTPIFDKLHGWKVGTPVGGGILIILVVTLLSLWSYGTLSVSGKFWELFVLLFAFLSFGALGLYDDARKFFLVGKDLFFGLRIRHKLAIQFVLAAVVGFIFYFKLGFNFIYIQWLGKINIGLLSIPFITCVIVGFVNAFNITDGLDGLSSGLLVICLLAFWSLSAGVLGENAVVLYFIGVWLGALIAFLYFNIYPARIWLGDVGALSFGATLAVIGLLTGKILALVAIGGVFILEAASSVGQLLAKGFFGKKILTCAPLHLYFQYRGWEEPKVVARFWLAGIIFGLFGVWLGLLG